MTQEPDYKAAYNNLMQAIDESTRILYRAQIMTATKLRIEKGEQLEEEVIEGIKEMGEQIPTKE